MRISYWSSDLCSSDLGVDAAIRVAVYDLQFSQPLQIALGNQVEAKVDLIPEHDESVAVVQIAAELRQLLLERVCGVVQLCPEIKSPGDRVRPAFQNIGDYIGSITVDHRVGWQGSHRPHGGRVHPGATGKIGRAHV